jgi:plastocyanin domain-containing protein
MMKRFVALLCLASLHAGCGGTKGAEIPVSVTENGFEPSRIEVKHDQPVTLLVTRKTDQTCATEIVVPSRGITQSLPLNETVRVALGPLKTGEVAFACGMDMEKGTIAVR